MQVAERSNARVAPKGETNRWIPSSCSLCYGNCSILAHNVNGVLTKIEGNPESACGEGRLCAKGVAGIMTLYDPNRVNVPLKRTNPRKGIGVDPGWVEISWEEALDTAVRKLKDVYDPGRRLQFYSRHGAARLDYPVGDRSGQGQGALDRKGPDR